MRWTEADLAKVNARLKGDMHLPVPAGGVRRPAKYRNRKVQHQGQKFDSQRECDAWKAFRLQELHGGIRAVIRQVSMPMPASHRRIRIDFLIIENNGMHRWFDAKGYPTAEFKLKADIVKSAYGITIELI